jgi:hypothetical protein
MKYLLLVITLSAFYSCKDIKTDTIMEITEAPMEIVSGENTFTSYERVQGLIQGSWYNELDPESVILFEENTTTNKYQGVIALKGVPYALSTNCKNEAKAKLTAAFRYINTSGNYSECYYILTLNENKLIMEFEKGNITLTYLRLTED